MNDLEWPWVAISWHNPFSASSSFLESERLNVRTVQPLRFCCVLCIARSVSQPIGRHAQLTRCFSAVAELLVLFNMCKNVGPSLTCHNVCVKTVITKNTTISNNRYCRKNHNYHKSSQNKEARGLYFVSWSALRPILKTIDEWTRLRFIIDPRQRYEPVSYRLDRYLSHCIRLDCKHNFT